VLRCSCLIGKAWILFKLEEQEEEEGGLGRVLGRVLSWEREQMASL
jgi:hypothetical protein